MSTATVTDSVTDYNAKRAMILAQLVLTRRKGIFLFPFPAGSDRGPIHPGGTDFIAIFQHGGAHLFARVKGTDEVLDNEKAAFAYCAKHWKSMYAEGFLFAPAIFLLFSVEGDQGYFSWVLEPQVDREKGPTLTRLESPAMRKITKKPIEDVFDQVDEWYKAMMSEHLIRGKSSA